MNPNDRELVGLLEQIYQRSGCDLRGYARPPLRRRLRAWLGDRPIDSADLGELIEVITQHDTPIFGDPDADRALREQVVPFLRTFPTIQVWMPACASGGQAYATAIVLREERLGARSLVYATDVSEQALTRARRGLFAMSSLRAAEAGYLRGGGHTTLADYYVAGAADEAMVRPMLRDQLTFQQHDLTTGASFNEFHLIRCRDILPALGPALQDRVFGLFHDSLVRFGILALGAQDTVHLRPPVSLFEVIDAGARLYRRAR